jgi:hypothetical protein
MFRARIFWCASAPNARGQLNADVAPLNPLAYGKPGFKNDGFLAWGRRALAIFL